MDFSKRYAKLNKAQKKAVDHIDGPIMVIAGPGTGKTELISVRCANILQKTDTLPENILCLTFTESGAGAMRERLTSIIGKDAYKIAVHTFHSFGSEIINQNGQYFYQGAHFLPADELSSYEIIHDIFKKLPYDSPLSSKLNDEYTHLSDALTTISELKKSGLTSDELLAVLDDNNDVIEKSEQLLSPIFANRITKNTAEAVAQQIPAIRKSGNQNTMPSIVALSKVMADSMENAVNDAITSNSTKPITAWRNQWFKKDETGNFVLKTKNRQIKLRALSFVYEKYLTEMQKAALYDFDDMILRVVHALEIFDDLRYNLQEKYQYIMVDEFQDTNMAQMRILHNLTNNIAHGDTPNIMVVGDDDQAIYSFQGADISNILGFRENYPKTKLVTLTENYRSTADILDESRDIILQGHDRLENLIDEIDKKLSPQGKQSTKGVKLLQAENVFDERHYIATDIKNKIGKGIKPNDIAVLTRRHSEIHTLLPYFARHGVAVNYERRDNVLDIAPVKLLEQIAQLLINIFDGRHDEVNSALPEILAHKSWGIDPIALWKLSLDAYKNRKNWLDVMGENADFLPLRNWLIVTSALVNYMPLEQIIDIIIGKTDLTNETEGFTSPIYNYYFNENKLNEDPNSYVLYIESLRTIRAKLREYRPNKTPTLKTFIEFIALNRKIGNTISVIRRPTQSENAINVMTAHKSKGQEFDTVYIVNAVDNVWGQRARSRNSMISYPENLPLAPAGETEDERLRLFYVAVTRAKTELNISYSLTDDYGKNTLRASFLIDDKRQHTSILPPTTNEQLTEAVELAWYQPLANPTSDKMRDVLLPILKNYKLSVTHLNNFIDVTRGGPAAFLIKNLLRFPQSKSANAAYGTAMHSTIQNAHAYLSSTGRRQAPEDIVSKFEKHLSDQHLADVDFQNFLQKGDNALQLFLDQKYNTFTESQQTELDFSNQHSIISDAHITGKIDLVDINTTEKRIYVTDYKTGKPSRSWTGKTDQEKIKLHKYKQQLMFYKLLVENGRDYRGHVVDSATVQFVEPTTSGEIISLNIEFNDEELEQFKELLNAVWGKITNLGLPDITGYPSSYKGILAFEQDLIDNTLIA